MSRFTLHHGDSREVLKTLPDNSVDAIVCDPPYELTSARRTKPAPSVEGSPYSRHRVGVNGDNKPVGGFMGKEWDGTGVAFDVAIWAEALRVLKPGGYLLAFSGTRTYHRMACAIEDAGFEVRDKFRHDCSFENKYGALLDSLSDDQRGMLMELLNEQGLGNELGWAFGSGFPKSHNGEWGGTAAKPAWEPICVARKPLDGTVEANWRKWGTGALNISACRVGSTVETWPTSRSFQAGISSGFTQGLGAGETQATGEAPAGRWPANLIHDGSPEVVAQFPHSTSGAMKAGTQRAAQDEPGSVCYGTFGGNTTAVEIAPSSGSAARFFYCAKASQEDRNEGCVGLPEKVGGMVSNTSGQHITRRDGGAPGPRANHHPTVKPTELMAYLCRLVTPPGGTILDPFMGSGSTGKAAMLEGFNFIGIDLTPEYVEIARARIEFALRRGHQPSLLEAA